MVTRRGLDRDASIPRPDDTCNHRDKERLHNPPVGLLRLLADSKTEQKERPDALDSPRFTLMTGRLCRVKDRLERVPIGGMDMKFVAAERLLKKTAAGRAKARNHLAPFARFYGNHPREARSYGA